MVNINQTKTKILITGGLGFLGTALTDKLINLNYQVVIFDNYRWGNKNYYNKKVKIIKGDVRNKKDWEKIPKCDYVFHFGSPSSIVLFNKNLKECVDITIKGFINCIHWGISNKVKKIIYPSSGSVYGNNKKNTENRVSIPVNVYGKTKLICEQIAKTYEEKIPLLGLRIFAGFGPQEFHKNGFASVVTLIYKKMIVNKPPLIFGDGNQKRDFIYIDDIVKVCVAVLNNNITGIINVGSGQAISFNKVVFLFNLLLKKNIKSLYKKSPKNYFDSRKADISKLKNLLNYSPTSFKESLLKYLKAAQTFSNKKIVIIK